MQPRRTNESRLDAGRRHQRQIADELDRVAEAVVVEHQHALARLPRPLPGRKPRAERIGERSCPEASAPRILQSRVRNRRASAGGSPSRRRPRGFRALSAASNAASASAETPEVAQRQGFAAQRRREIRARCARPPISGERLLHAVELEERIAEVDRGFGEFGPKRECALCRFERILEASELAQGAGAAAPGVGVAGLKRARRLEVGERSSNRPMSNRILPALR